jgi:hypothetical protein
LRFEAVSRRSSLEQLLPPLVLFLPLLARTGTMLVLGCAVVAAALAFALCRLGWLVWRHPPAGTRTLRSLLTVAFAVPVLALSWLQSVPVHGYVDNLSRQLQQQCNTGGACPARIASWDDVPGGSDREMGRRVSYPIRYRTDGRAFRLCWVAAFDRCRTVTGGVDAPLRPAAPLPWPEFGSEGPQ